MTIRGINRRSITSFALSVLGVACFTLASFSLPGCSTVEGVGKDIQHASEATADAINGDD
jgi:predicted small secreted protein